MSQRRSMGLSVVSGIILVSCGGASGFNTMVNNPNSLANCAGLIPGQSLADDFVCANNQVRATPPDPQPLPQPSLPAVSWNTELAAFAQAHADNCNFVHSDDALRTATFGEWVGENLAANTGTRGPAEVVASWAAEALDYDYSSNTCAAGKVCGHYTQLVWRSSIEIGCAMSVCPTLQGTGFSNAQFWVCNYRPGGNIIGQKPY